MKILTDIELRAHWYKTRETSVVVEPDTVLTPAAKDFIKEHNIRLVMDEPACEAGCRTYVQTSTAGVNVKAMPMAKVPMDAAHKPVYIDSATGKQMNEKPENMTHLHGNVLVPKTHPQITFRGTLDTLEAKILSVQIMTLEDGLTRMNESLGEILDYVRKILSAEVMEQPLAEISLLGLDSQGLRYESHHIREIYGIPHPMPDQSMGRVCLALNELRTSVREAELAAAKAFYEGDKCSRMDIIEGLNRLSSAIYLLFCRQLTGIWPCYTVEEPKPGIMVEASGRHVHLTEEAIQILFGGPLHRKSDLSQPGQYACEERVTLMTAKGELERVVVLGPARKDVQVEISTTDERILGIDAPIRMSGDLKGAADVILVGPNGIYNAMGSTIVAKAHIHMAPEDAVNYGVIDGQHVSVRLDTERPVTIDDVVIRVSKDFKLAMHMDYDEANACDYKKGTLGYIVY